LDSRLNFLSASKILKSLGLRPRKSLGQSFLQDLTFLVGAFQFLQLNSDARVLEIGAGMGHVTVRILETGATVVALEIDDRFLPILSSIQKSFSNFRYLIQNACTVSWDELWRADTYSVFGNIPYYITGPILERLLLKEKRWVRAAFLLQEEVANRLVSKPSNKAYSSLTLVTQYKARVSLGQKVPRGSFFPIPKVDSAFVHLERKEKTNFQGQEEAFFLDLVRGAFRERRKTLANNLLRMFPQLSKIELFQVINGAGIDPGCRSETLTLEEFSSLAKSLMGVLS